MNVKDLPNFSGDEIEILSLSRGKFEGKKRIVKGDLIFKFKGKYFSVDTPYFWILKEKYLFELELPFFAVVKKEFYNDGKNARLHFVEVDEFA